MTVAEHQVTHIVIGNGTASRETVQLAAEAVPRCPSLRFAVVNEAGISTWSASEDACTEFPDVEVSLRSAVALARRWGKRSVCADAGEGARPSGGAAACRPVLPFQCEGVPLA